jgi:serine/threonine-protein kinase RsbW
MTEAAHRSARRDSGPVSALPASTGTAARDDLPQAWISAFPARPDQVRHARHGLARALGECGCPVIDEALLCLSELASNAVLHSASRFPGGTFTVRADIRPGQHVRIEVHDRGGPWHQADHADGRLHGLAIVRTLAQEAGVCGGESAGWTAWAQLAWPAPG